MYASRTNTDSNDINTLCGHPAEVLLTGGFSSHLCHNSMLMDDGHDGDNGHDDHDGTDLHLAGLGHATVIRHPPPAVQLLPQ